MFEERIKKLQDLLTQEDLDALFITNPYNIYYLTGFIGVSVIERETVVMVTKEGLIFYAPKMYEEQVNESKKRANIIVKVLPERHYLFSYPATDMVHRMKVGFESLNLKYLEYQKIKGNSEAELIPTEGLVEKLRISKDEEEIKIAQKAVDITDQTFEFLTKNIKRGMSEKQVARMIRDKMEDFGADGMSFNPIVANGAGSALPHYSTSEKEITEGILLIDMGASFGGYMGDLTRTMHVGEPSQRFIDTYNLVLKAEETAIEKTHAGMSCEESWQIAVDILGDQAQYFIHGLGHGIGLDTHEDPYLRKDIKQKLELNSLVTIEPGLYYPDWGGIRIEDYVVVKKQRCEVLSKASKEIIVI